ncbi:sensor histidine kinase [Paenibacillus thermoaerophilus]|uniref:histidine kinase n=1 Tax=Paenibacillus thermoaerophilus TaxID=1215385 RepID=A0ABW2V3G4_9BACL|nr:histidine kinase [Paenibacillus thermoaerophilus]TMV12003.1 sensor histidine kinase [Paenibacillus thermoaerophilus]
MRPRHIKWLILLIPTLTIGLWEYIRHEFLLPYLSMDAGNWLAPVIVFGVTLAVIVPLFSLLEETEEELNASMRSEAVLREREKFARELHDGVAQSLFLLSVQADRLQRGVAEGAADIGAELTGLRRTIRETDEYVRQAIAGLRGDPDAAGEEPWTDTIRSMFGEFERNTRCMLDWRWELPDRLLGPREKIELFSSLREGLMNVRKHAKDAANVRVRAAADRSGGWTLTVADDGTEFPQEDGGSERFGLDMIRRRAAEFGWLVSFGREGSWTVLSISKPGGGGKDAAVSGVDRR